MNEVLEQDSLIRLSVFNHASDALQPDFSKNAFFVVLTRQLNSRFLVTTVLFPSMNVWMENNGLE